MKLLDESKYQLMWMMVMFDLPVVDKKERKEATKFRDFLLEMGFQMSQFSVYFRFCGTREHVDRFVRKIAQNTPPQGKVSILTFTDKQFGDIVNLSCRQQTQNPEKPQQLMLF